MSLNIALFEKIKCAIREDARRMDMSFWMSTADGGRIGNVPFYLPLLNECHTIACVAGWGCFFSGKVESFRDTATHLRGKFAYSLFHVDVLDDDGTPDYDHMRPWNLFGIHDWPRDLREKLPLGEPGTPEYAEVVCMAIDRFIADYIKEFPESAPTVEEKLVEELVYA